jgi:histidine ammonia-lyase
VRDVFAFAKSVFLREANSTTDNPVIVENGDILSCGNFHAMPLALAADALTMASVSLANISERRIDSLCNPIDASFPRCGIPDAGLSSGLMMVAVTATALTAEARAEASPASIHSIPTSGGREDHVPMAPLATRKCRQVIESIRAVLGLEILCAAQVLEFHKPLRAGRGVCVAHRCVREGIPFIQRDVYMKPIVATATSANVLRRLLATVEKECGALV